MSPLLKASLMQLNESARWMGPL